MRYSLNKEVTKYGLYQVLDNGEVTKAFASEEVKFSDKCEVHGGVFRGGVFHGGVFRGGEFRGGVFHGGVFHGGEFRGGEFRGGVFHGGVFRENYLINQIQGSIHFVNSPDGKVIKIGCKEYTPSKWQKHYQTIGKAEGYTDAQIEEYKLYIDLFTKLIEGNEE